MDVALMVDAVRRVAGVDPVTADLDALKAGLADVGRVRRWLDGREVAFTNGLHALASMSPSVIPEAAAAEATGTSVRQAMRVADRARTADQLPALAAALSAGTVSGEHVDAMTAGLRSLEPAERPALTAQGERLARLAGAMPADDFRREVTKATQQIRADAGMARLERQRRDVRVRTWLNEQTGMVHLNGRFDPETGGALINRLTGRVDQLFRETSPELCPSDPLDKQDFLRGHALLSLVNIKPDGTTTTGTGTAAATPTTETGAGASPATGPESDGSGGVLEADGTVTAQTGTGDTTQPAACACGRAGVNRADFVITIDLRTLVDGYHPNTRIDTGIPGLELPLETLRRMAMFADITLALLDEDGVVLKLGRTRRLANRAQRRALRGMYRHCAVPGCRVPISKTQPHHTLEWDADQGPTDIEFLVPICKHHHDLIHRHNWQLSLSPDRRLTITYPDGTTMTTGPPREQWE